MSLSQEQPKHVSVAVILDANFATSILCSFLRIMASAPPTRPVSLAQSIDDSNLDGAVTWDEAVANTDGMKILFLDKPMVVNKPPGQITIGSLPAKDEIVDCMKQKTQFLDVLLGYEGDIDLKQVETLFLQQRYQDFPEPIRVKGNNVTPYTMQLFIVPKGDRKWDIVKHIRFAAGARVWHSTILGMSVGRPLEIDYQKQFREGSRALQYMLEGLGGFQVRYAKIVPGAASKQLPKETEDIRKGFQFLRDHGPEDNSNGQFTSWTEEQVNDPSGPLYKWDKGTVKEFLRSMADQGSTANTIRDWPLTLVDFTPWALNTVIAPVLPHLLEHAVIWIGKSQVGKSPIAYTLSHLLSSFWLLQEERADDVPSFQTSNHLDYFRKEKGRKTKPRVFDDGNLNLEHPASVKAVTEVSGIDRKTMARYTASSYEKNQLCQVCSNPYDRTVEPVMGEGSSSDHIDFDTFFKLVRPSFHKDFDYEDLIAVFKRSVVVVFTDRGIYIRLPGTSTAPVPRRAWPSADVGMVSHCARAKLAAYKRGQLSAAPAEHGKHLQWSLNLLQAGLDGETIPRCSTISGKNFDGKKFIRETRPRLAGIDATTTYFPDQSNEADTENVPKRFKSVKSTQALLTNPSSSGHDSARTKAEEDTEVKPEDASPSSFVGVSGLSCIFVYDLLSCCKTL